MYVWVGGCGFGSTVRGPVFLLLNGNDSLGQNTEINFMVNIFLFTSTGHCIWNVFC